MAKIEDGTLIIIEGDKYIMKGNTLVFLPEGSEEDGNRRIDEERKASD